MEPTADTFLAIELVENYLTLGKPQHESIQTRFGLTTAKKQRPVAWYEDYSYTKEGDSEQLTSKTDLAYDLYPVTMGEIFSSQDADPEETSCIVIFREEGKVDGIAICAWDRDTAMKIMDLLHRRNDPALDLLCSLYGQSCMGAGRSLCGHQWHHSF